MCDAAVQATRWTTTFAVGQVAGLNVRNFRGVLVLDGLASCCNSRFWDKMGAVKISNLTGQASVEKRIMSI